MLGWFVLKYQCPKTCPMFTTCKILGHSGYTSSKKWQHSPLHTCPIHKVIDAIWKDCTWAEPAPTSPYWGITTLQRLGYWSVTDYCKPFLSSLPDNFLPPIYTPGGWRERHRESNVDKNKTHRTWHALKSGLVTMRWWW